MLADGDAAALGMAIGDSLIVREKILENDDPYHGNRNVAADSVSFYFLFRAEAALVSAADFK